MFPPKPGNRSLTLAAPCPGPAQSRDRQGAVWTSKTSSGRAPAAGARILTRFEELEELAGEWERLRALAGRHTIFQRYAWARAWREAFGDGHALCAPVVWEGGRPAGILPLVRDGARLRFLGHSASDYNAILCAPERAGEMLERSLAALAENARGWGALWLENVPSDSPLAGVLETLPPAARRRTHARAPVDCPALAMGEGKADVLARLLNKDKVRKTSRALERLGAVSFRHLETGEEIAAHLPLFFRQHIRRQALAGRTSRFVEEQGMRFARALAERLDTRKELRFAVLEVDGRPAAYHLGFEADGVFYYYKPAFDIDLWEQSPGQVLLYHLFKYAAGGDIAEFNFGVGGEGYKYRFANETRRNLTFEVSPPGWRGLWRMAWRDRRREAVRLVRARPRLLKAAESVLQAPRALGERFAWDRVRTYRRRDGAIAEGYALRPVTLAGLADASLAFPELDAAALQRARERIRRGEAAHLLMHGGALRGVAWALKGEGGTVYAAEGRAGAALASAGFELCGRGLRARLWGREGR